MPVKSTAAARSRSCKPPTSNPVTRNRWPAAILLLVTFLVYIPTLRFQFVYDDMHQVVGNSHIQSWTYLPDYFTKHVWSQSESYNVRYYRPLFLVWLRLNHALFGLEPAYWHLATVAAHALATLLVYVLVRSLLCEWTTALLAALFFGLHPVHVEVAAWFRPRPRPCWRRLCWARLSGMAAGNEAAYGPPVHSRCMPWRCC